MFWLICLLLAAAAGAFVLLPIWLNRADHSAESSRDETQVQLYREHLADLEAARARGEVTEAEYQELELELQRTLVAEVGPGSGGAATANGGTRVLWAAALVVPIAGFVAYGVWGAKPDWDIYTFMETVAEAQSQEEYQRGMAELLERVSDRAAARPDNSQYQNLLAQTASALGDHQRAAAAYRKLLQEFPDHPTLLARAAQTGFYAAGNSVTPEVRDYVTRALARAPMLPDMHALAGIDAQNQGDYASAMRHWETALSVTPRDSAAARGYRAGIERARAAMAAAGLNSSGAGQAVADAAPAAQQAVPAPSATAPAASASAAAAPEAKPADAKAALPVSVRLADGVAVPPEAVVFVYARAWQGARMPLAIARLSASELPASITLTEAMAMAPGMTLQTFPQLEVVARISPSGNATAQPGDWQATFGPVTLAGLSEPVQLVVSERLP